MTRDTCEAVAREWVDCWNRADIDALMAHYAEDVVFVSPRAETVTGKAAVEGRSALRAYWMAAMERTASRRFTLERVIYDDEQSEMVVVYVSAVDGARVETG